MRKFFIDLCKNAKVSAVLYNLKIILTNVYTSLFLTIVILFLIGYLIYSILTIDSDALNVLTENDLHHVKKRDYTIEELKMGNGKDGADMLVAVGGKVFDVSCKGYYLFREGAPFNLFLGKDATRALATFSLEQTVFKEQYDDLFDLSASEVENVKEWLLQFEEQYPCVGKLIKNFEGHTDYEESFEYEYNNCDIADTSSNDNSNKS